MWLVSPAACHTLAFSRSDPQVLLGGQALKASSTWCCPVHVWAQESVCGFVSRSCSCASVTKCWSRASLGTVGVVFVKRSV